MLINRTGLFSASLALLALTACSSDGSGGISNPPPPPPPAPTSFNQFVADQFGATADNTDPVAVDDVDFTIDEDPAAFDSLLQ